LENFEVNVEIPKCVMERKFEINKSNPIRMFFGGICRCGVFEKCGH
jgi:hypothetical protein